MPTTSEIYSSEYGEILTENIPHGNFPIHSRYSMNAGQVEFVNQDEGSAICHFEQYLFLINPDALYVMLMYSAESKSGTIILTDVRHFRLYDKNNGNFDWPMIERERKLKYFLESI